MICSSSLLLAIGAAILPALARDLPDPSTANTSLPVSNRFIVEFSTTGSSKFRKRDGSPSTSGFFDLVNNGNNTVMPGQNFTSDLFHGASFNLVNGTNVSLSEIEALPEVAHLWPVTTYSVETPKADAYENMSKPDFKAYHPHLLTNVLEAHERGYTGQGIIVATVDTGIDYTHPGLGGGFGPGYRVDKGYDFVGKDWSPATPDDVHPNGDPMDCNGHGTHVAGILGSSWPQLIGVAPNVTLRSYKVFGCLPYTSSDLIIQGFLMAYESGADIISGSLGSDQGFIDNPTAVVINRIVEQGTMVITAVGNSGSEGPFLASNTANSYGGLAVADGQVKYQLGYEVVATSSSGATHTFQYVSSDSKPFPINGSRKVFMLDVPADYDICYESYPEDAAQVPDDQILVLPRGTGFSCSSGWQQMDSELIGYANYVFYWNYQNVSYETPERIVYREDQPKGFGAINYDDGMWFFNEHAAGHNITIEFTQNSRSDDQGAAYISDSSSWGPTIDGNMKPEITGPGTNILSTWPMDGGGWMILDGTSMATPYISGVAALYFQSVGGRKWNCGKNPVEVARRRIIASGRTIRHSDMTTSLGAVAQQGAGLVDAMKVVVDFKTAVDPSNLSLNDTDHFKGTHEIEVRNTGGEAVTYKITHEAGPTVRVHELGDAYIEPYPNLVYDAGQATVEFSVTELTVPAQGKASFTVKFTEPSDIAANILPLYAGYIYVAGSNNETTKVTYQGIKGSLAAQQVWETQNGVPAFYTAENKQFRADTVFPEGTLPNINFNILWSTREFSFDVVTADWQPSDWVYPPVAGQNNWVGSTVYIDPDTDSEVPFPQTYFSHLNSIFLLSLTGNFSDGRPLENGRYRMIGRALNNYGDYKNIKDWQYRLSNTFIVGSNSSTTASKTNSTALPSSVLSTLSIDPTSAPVTTGNGIVTLPTVASSALPISA